MFLEHFVQDGFDDLALDVGKTTTLNRSGELLLRGKFDSLVVWSVTRLSEGFFNATPGCS